MKERIDKLHRELQCWAKSSWAAHVSVGDGPLLLAALDQRAELLRACHEALWACKGKEYDPDRFDKAADLCEKAIKKCEAPCPTT